MAEEDAPTGTRKADFTDIYQRPDPRAYYATLAPLDYQVPEHARPVVQAALGASGQHTLLDICCSYGINSALLRHELCTGGVGYIGVRTFERLLAAAPHPERLWVVVFVPRTFDYTGIADVLGRYGLVTERLPGTFRQRRFADRAEQEAAVSHVRRLGLDPAGLEADGWYHAECYVARPATGAYRS